jgi:hypothetical protein
MTAKVLSPEIERVRHQRAKKGAAQHDTRALEAKSHASLNTFEASRDQDQSARLLSMFEGDPGRQATDFLRECQKVQRANAGLLMSIGETIAGSILQHAAYLLHVATSLLPTGNNLGSNHVQSFARKSEDVRR